jgi:hypothetical protein
MAGSMNFVLLSAVRKDLDGSILYIVSMNLMFKQVEQPHGRKCGVLLHMTAQPPHIC